VVFTVPPGARGDHGERIERAIADRLGVSSRVTVVSARALGEIVRGNTLAKRADNPSLLLVGILSNPRDRESLRPLLREKWAPEAFAAGARACYLWCPGGSVAGRLFPAVDRLLGEGVTTRNWATILKLHELAGRDG
jgi:uncharacterized protein (DUF1697 family)